MTDQLDADVRTMLAQRAGAVTVDTPAGEAAITERLAAGDAGLADVVSFGPRRRRPMVLVAAAVVLVAVVAAVLVTNDDEQVRTGPVATAPSSTAATLELQPVLLAGPCATLGAAAVPSAADEDACYLLGDPLAGNALIETASVSASVSFSATGTPIGCEPDCPTTSTSTTVYEESYGVSLTLTEPGIEAFALLESACFAAAATCPTGEIAIVVDDRVVSTLVAEAPTVERDSIEISAAFTEREAEELAALLDPRGTAELGAGTTTTTTPDTGEDPTVGEPGDAAKDVAERVALAVFGQDYVTMAAADVGAITEVTMEGAGGAVVAEVAFDAELGRERLIRIRPVDGPEQVGVVAVDGALTIEAPEAGSLSYRLLDETLRELGGDGVDGVPAGSSFPVAGLDDDGAAWIWVSLETPDGRVLQWLDRV